MALKDLFFDFLRNEDGFLGSILGSVLGSVISTAGNIFSSERQMGFQEQMSNTAHQREVIDLREAGLNPILSAKYGGASTPSGAGFDVGDLAHSAMQVAKMEAETQNLRKQNEAIESQTALNKQLEKVAQADVGVRHATAKQIGANTAVTQTTLPGLQIEQDIDQTMYGQILRYIGRLNPFTSNAKNLLGPINSFFSK